MSSELVCPKGFRVQFYDGDSELKWCLFVDGKRGSIGKLITSIITVFLSNSRTAKIKSLFVKPQYRGNALGLVLLDQCLRHLSFRGFGAVCLDAEEDVTRHGRLVSFYEGCGFAVTAPLAKPQITYNGDQCLRVVPMDCRLPHELSKYFDNAKGTQDHKSLLHLLRMHQTLEFVQNMEAECVDVSRASMSLVDALLVCDRIESGFLARRLACMRFAKAAGQPDFVQLAVLIYTLGQIQRQFEWKTPQMVMAEKSKGVADEIVSKEDFRSRSVHIDGRSKPAHGNGSAKVMTSSPQSTIQTNNLMKKMSKATDAIDQSIDKSNESMDQKHEHVPFVEWAAVPLTHESWVVGCALPNSLEESSLNAHNPDMHDTLLNTDTGCYEPACGMAALRLTWSDQEYLWQVLKNKNHAPIPDDALSALRLQRLYSWTKHGEYSVLCDGEEDEEACFWTRSIGDLVSEFDKTYVWDGVGILGAEECRRVLESEAVPVIDKYAPGVLQW